MLIQLCLVTIALTLILLVVILLKAALQAKESFELMQADLHKLIDEMSVLVNSVNEFIHADLHALSDETSQLVNNLSDLSSELIEKTRSPGLFFKLLSPFIPKLSFASPSDGGNSKCETIPQLMKWIASSIFLFKSTKEIIKKYEKRT